MRCVVPCPVPVRIEGIFQTDQAAKANASNNPKSPLQIGKRGHRYSHRYRKTASSRYFRSTAGKRAFAIWLLNPDVHTVVEEAVVVSNGLSTLFNFPRECRLSLNFPIVEFFFHITPRHAFFCLRLLHACVTVTRNESALKYRRP